MKFINIYPVTNSEEYLKQDMNMFLTHLVLEDKIYRETAKKSSGYKILDNSLIELGGSVLLEDVIKAAEMIGADEIVLPDVFRDGMTTFELAKKYLEKYEEELSKYKVMAVVHGKDITEWMVSYLLLENLPGVDVLGIPKVLDVDMKEYGGRPGIVNEFMEHCLKEIHLLGLWYNIRELKDYRYPNKIRSVDTSLMNLLSIQGRDFTSSRKEGEQIDLVYDHVFYLENAERAHEYVSRLT